MYIHPDTVQTIKETAVIFDVVSDYVKDLKKVGARYRAKSPFTNEKTPSFYVSPTKNIFHCFSSGVGGDAIKFLMEHEKVEFPEACKRLALKYSIDIKHHTPTEEEKKELDEKEALYKLNRAALNQWQTALFNSGIRNEYERVEQDNWPIGEYWTTNFYPSVQNPDLEENPIFRELIYKRRLSLDIVLQFGIGYAPDSWKFLYPKIKEIGQVTLAQKIGLIKSGKQYDSFRHRIIYPIHDHNGKLVGFGGRALYEEVKDGKKQAFEFIDGEKAKDAQGNNFFTAKAINSPESLIYEKKRVLYGLNIAGKSIRSKDVVYIVEGYNDVLAMHQAEFTNTVGTCGTALTKEHLRLLSRYTKNLNLCFDGDVAGRKAAMKAADMAIREGFEVSICLLPMEHDPDSYIRSMSSIEKIKSSINERTDSAILQIAQLRIDEIETPQSKEKLSQELGSLISHISGDTIRDYLCKSICKLFEITPSTFRKILNDHLEVRSKEQVRRQIFARKNEVIKLQSEPQIYPFFVEKRTAQDEFKEIKINKARFVNLLKHFGYSRYYVEGSDAHTFVRICENLIQEVQQDEIIDHIEDFIYTEYDFEGRPDVMYTDAEMLWNKFLDGQRSYFNKDIFARVRNSDKIIINKDTKDSTFFYYKNGFVEINEEGWNLRPYTELEGGIWEKQMNSREFTPLTMKELGGSNIADLKAGTFANFVWKISGSDQDRFYALCSIIGYSVHDYYEYKLKAINITDSSLSDKSDGRSGKTLLLKMMKYVRNVAEINGKEFRQDDKGKYADVDIYSQLVGLNDIVTKGRYKFSFENSFNDITEGAMVKKLYMDPFRKFFKMWILSNDPLEIHGGSQRDRLIEFELSTFFNSNHSPEDEYGIWLGRDFDQKEWMYYDNFMCFCAWIFHVKGIISPPSINLNTRKLKTETKPEFLDFMNDCAASLTKTTVPWDGYIPNEKHWIHTMIEKEENGSKTTVRKDTDLTLKDVVIEKNAWYDRMMSTFKELNERFHTRNAFSKWLKIYALYEYGIQNPYEYRSNGVGYFMFKEKAEVEK